MEKKLVGEGKVVLLAGGGKCYTDIAARFVSSERTVEEIINSPYTPKIVKNILDRGHMAATEFDTFIFGIEGYSRVTEVQMVRKRIGSSYLIKSGRTELNGKRSYELVIPEEIQDVPFEYSIDAKNILIGDPDDPQNLKDVLGVRSVTAKLTAEDLMRMGEIYYEAALALGIDEQFIRYLKPQGTGFKAIVQMNVRVLLEFFAERCCACAQPEIQDLARKMLAIVKPLQPDLFVNGGAKCIKLNYCPENSGQFKTCKGKIPTHTEVIAAYESSRAMKNESKSV